MTPRNRTARPYHLFHVSLPALAAELGVDVMGMTRMVRRAGMEDRRLTHPGHDHRVKCLTLEDATTLRAYHAAHRAPGDELPHWLTAEQAARALGLTVGAFHQRRHAGSLRGKIGARRLCGPGCTGNVYRYNPADVAREARLIGIRPRVQPRGTITSAELQAICGVNKSTTARWARRGCPAVQLGGSAYCFRPAEVLAWMDAQQRSRYTRDHIWQPFATARTRLRAHLTQERAA